MVNRDVKRIAIVLPAFNEEKDVSRSLERVTKGMDSFEGYEFYIYTVDDGSTDKTTEKIGEWKEKHPFVQVRHHKNTMNIGLVETLRETYKRILKDGDIDFVLKTDLDREFDQALVVKMMVPMTNLYNFKAAVGVRSLELTEEVHAYAFKKKAQIKKILKEKFDLEGVEPGSSGTMMFSMDILEQLLKNPLVTRYDKRWGLDFLMMLCVCEVFNERVQVVLLERSSYDETSNTDEKVKKQTEAYKEIIMYVEAAKK